MISLDSRRRLLSTFHRLNKKYITLLAVFIAFFIIVQTYKEEPMNKTNIQTITDSTITTNVEGLMQLLGCGKETAKSIGELAETRVKTNNRRTIYSIEKIRNYCLTNTY